MRNVAAVLVTAELSFYLSPSGRFEVQVSSLGDARSLRGGVLWMTRLVADAGAAINAALGGGSAMVEAPGSVALSLAGEDRPGDLACIGELLVQPDRAARVVIDGRDGAVVAG